MCKVFVRICSCLWCRVVDYRFFMITDFCQLKNQVRTFYDSLGKVYCPYFSEEVYFSSDGFRHLLYKGSLYGHFKLRKKSQRMLRLKLFKLAPRLLRITTTVQEYHQEKQFVLVTYNQREENILKSIQYWGFIAIISDQKVKVVVKQIGEGQKQFWSIIPNWITRKSYEQYKRFYYSGDLQHD